MRNITSSIDCAFCTLTSIIILALLAAGCSLAESPAEYTPLAETWPTPEASGVTPSPTPFPRFTLSPAATPTATRITATVTPLASATLQATPVSPPENPDKARPTAWAEVVSPGLNVRSGPGLDHPVIASLKQGDRVPVLEIDPGSGWLRVQVAGDVGTGWISGKPAYVSLREVPPAAENEQPPVSPAAPAETKQLPAPGSTGRLVIQSSSGGDIYVINADGSGLRRLTNGIDPAISPDGQSVAFTRWNGEDGSLWLINIDGSNERQVLGETKQAKHPAWSPDGQRILVNFQHGGRLEKKRVCTRWTGEMPDIPWNVDPDSIHMDIKDGIPYLCWVLPPDPHWGVRVVNVADNSYQDVPSDSYAFGPEWDPANSWRIISSGLNGLVQLDVNRMEQWPLTDRREDHTPVFSPDGRYIAVAFKSGGHWQIQRLNADGSGRVAFTHISMSAVVEGRGPWNDTAPAWSPDGSQIAFLTDRAGRWEVWVMNADGSDQRPLFGADVQAQLRLEYHSVDERMISWTG
jgi:TolB protein